MTRRERHLRIIEWFDDRHRRWQLDALLHRRKMTVFTDDAIEELAAALVRDYRREQKMNRENRARRSA
jgi:hypothetical protein